MFRAHAPYNPEYPDMSLHTGVLHFTLNNFPYFTSVMRPVFTCRCSAPVAISRYR